MNRKRFLRISLRTSLVLVAILCLCLGKLSIAAHRQKKAVEWIESHGGSAMYEFEQEPSGAFAHKPAQGWRARLLGSRFAFASPWAKLLGKDCVSTVTGVQLSDKGVESISPLSALIELQYLELNGNKIADLKPLAPLRKLRVLDVGHNSITDLSPIAEMGELQTLRINGNHIADWTPLGRLPKLKEVTISIDDAPASETIEKLRPGVTIFYRQNNAVPKHKPRR
jgi:hypothetical protein